MQNKIKESLEKKKECNENGNQAPAKPDEKHYKEYTNQPDQSQGFTKDDFNKVHSILDSMKQKNQAIKDSKSSSGVGSGLPGSPTQKAEAHAKLIDDALKENDYFIDHKDVKKQVKGSGLEGIVNEIAGECEKLSKAVSPSSSYDEPVTPYIPPAQESTPYVPPSAPESTETTQSVPDIAPTPAAPSIPYNNPPSTDVEPSSVSIMGMKVSVSDSAPAEQAPAPPAPESEPSDLQSSLENFDSNKLQVDNRQLLAAQSIQKTINQHKTETSQLTKLIGDISDEPVVTGPPA